MNNQFLVNYFVSLFPNIDTRNLFFDLIKSENDENIILYSSGASGKTTLCYFLEETLGLYKDLFIVHDFESFVHARGLVIYTCNVLPNNIPENYHVFNLENITNYDNDMYNKLLDSKDDFIDFLF